MFDKTEAIVLRYYPTSNTSRIVNWLTKTKGKVTTIIKGSQRPKSAFIGQYDQFYTCELLYYHKDGRDVQYTKECSPLKYRRNLRTNWRSCAAASYFTHTISYITPHASPDGSMFNFLDAILDELNRVEVNESFMFWAELKLLQTLGHAPNWKQCQYCGESKNLLKNKIYFGIQSGGILCEQCKGDERHRCFLISPAAWQICRSLQAESRPEVARRTKLNLGQSKEIQALLGPFIETHLDIPPESRQLAYHYIYLNPVTLLGVS